MSTDLLPTELPRKRGRPKSRISDGAALLQVLGDVVKLSTGTIAELEGVENQTVLKWIHAGEFPPGTVHRHPGSRAPYRVSLRGYYAFCEGTARRAQ